MTYITITYMVVIYIYIFLYPIVRVVKCELDVLRNQT